MAYGDGGSGGGSSGSNVTFKGFSSKADRQNFKFHKYR